MRAVVDADFGLRLQAALIRPHLAGARCPPSHHTCLPPATHRLLEWQQQKVWCNTRPQEEGYPVQMQYRSTDGRLKPLPPGGGATALAAACDSQPLTGRPLLWLPPARDAALQEAAAALGAANHNVAASGRASGAGKEEGAVLVRGSTEDHMPASYSHLPWTTPDLLIVSVHCCVFGSLGPSLCAVGCLLAFQ